MDTESRYVHTPGVGVGAGRVDDGTGVRVLGAIAEGKAVSVLVGMGRVAVVPGGNGVFSGVPVPWGAVAVGAGTRVTHAAIEAPKRTHSAAARVSNLIRLMLRLYGLCRSLSIRFDNIGLPRL